MSVGQKAPENEQKPDPQNNLKDPAVKANVKPAVKKTGWLAILFSKEYRLGRINRNVVRTAGWVVALFAMGFFTVYILLYLPLFQDYEKLSQSYDASQQQLKTAQAGFKATQESAQKAQTSLDRTKISNAILEINYQTLQIELALSQHDQVGAADYLKRMQASTEAFLPEASKVDADLANMVDARVKVVALEYTNDPAAAHADLEAVNKYLQTLITKISQ